MCWWLALGANLQPMEYAQWPVTGPADVLGWHWVLTYNPWSMTMPAFPAKRVSPFRAIQRRRGHDKTWQEYAAMLEREQRQRERRKSVDEVDRDAYLEYAQSHS